MMLDVNNQQKIKAVVWEDKYYLNDQRCFRPGSMVEMLNFTFSEQYNNYNVATFQLVSEASIGLSDERIQEYRDFLFNVFFIHEFWDYTEYRKKLRGYVKGIFEQNWENVKNSPAAKTIHHAYKGGVLQHSMEMLYIYASSYKMYQVMVHEDVLMGILCHDFFKFVEYNMNYDNGLISYIEETLVQYNGGHIFLGAVFAFNAGQFRLSHIIATHHNLLEHGAITKPQLLEAELVHKIDVMSATFGVKDVDHLINNLSTDDISSPVLKLLDSLK